MAKLVAHSGPTAGKEFALVKDLVVMGRQSTSDIQIVDNLASRAQCNIRRDGRLYSLVDLGSRNGTLLNGKKVGERLLFPGDRIRIGEVEFIFVKETGDAELKDLLTKYELKKKIGEGGMGIVFTAVQRSMAREVALKILAPKYANREKFVEQFIAEARAAGKLNHQNLIQVHDVGTENGIHYFSMECVDGPTCLEMLRAQGQLEPSEALEIVRQVAKGLEYAHDHRLIHQDIKPDNIMVGTNNVVKLADLGISKTFDEVAADAPQGNESKKIMGTPHYMAPEAAMGKKIDHRIDIYSLGATLWHLLTGKTVFHGITPTEVLKAHVTEELPNLTDLRPGISPSVVALVAKMLAKKPEDRPQSAREIVVEVERIIAAEFKSASGGPETEILKRYVLGKATGNDGARLPNSTEATPFEGVAPESARFKRHHLAFGVVAGMILVGGVAFFLGQAKPEVVEIKPVETTEDPGTGVKSVIDPGRVQEDERLKGFSLTLNQLDSILAKPADQIDVGKFKAAMEGIPTVGLPSDFLQRRHEVEERFNALMERKRSDAVQDAFSKLSQELDKLQAEDNYAGALAALEEFPGKNHPRVAKAFEETKADIEKNRSSAIAELDERVRTMVTRRDLAELKSFKAKLAKSWQGTPQETQVNEAIRQVEGIRNNKLELVVSTCAKDLKEWNFTALAEHRRAAGKTLDGTPALAQIERFQEAAKGLTDLAKAIGDKLEQVGAGTIRFRGTLGGFQDPDLMRASFEDGLELKEAKGGAVFVKWAKVPPKDLQALATLLLKAEAEASKPYIDILAQATGNK